MNHRFLLIDIDRCIRCHACEVACKQENNLPAGPRWTTVATVGPRIVEGVLHQDFVFATCLHCDDPACMAVCSTGAVSKTEDGTVRIEESLCKGCGLCELACPFGVVHLNPDTGIAWKCNLCADRVESGLPPTCVQHCAGGALQYLFPPEIDSIVAGRHLARFGKVCYISSKWRLTSTSVKDSAKSDHQE